MCGIAGYWDPEGASEAIVRSMAAQIRHRGPDDEGTFVDGPVALANRRLSIIDLQSGRQPISNEDETIHIVFNGEIYNYAELRADLIERGHRFCTHTDTETIVHLYEEYGPQCVDKLNGMFAFAIWDDAHERLFLARDHLGQKPLYYSSQNGRFTFASEIKALLKYPGQLARFNVRAMHDLLSLRCTSGSHTLFAGIQKLPAGHTLTLHHGALAVERYWDLTYTPKLTGSEDDLVHQLRDLLQETVQHHLVSDVPIGAFLSGGIDSSLIVAMMARVSERPVKTFSIGVREDSFNELPYARILANHCRTEHHEATVDSHFIATLPEMIFFMEEPVDPFAFGVYSAARLAADHVKVVLGGDGGDEIFAGYDRYLGNQLVSLYCRLPLPVRRHVVEPLIERLPDSYRYNNRVQKLRWLAAMSGSSGARRYADSACYLRFNHQRKRSLYTDQLWQELAHEDASDYLLQFFESNHASSAIDRMLYTDVKTRLADHLLMVGDRMTMAHSIEGRSPFVDRRVAGFVAKIPANMKVRGRRLKHVQRRVAEGLIPPSLIRRKKQGFSFPIAKWFKTDLRQTFAHLLLEGNLVGEGYFRAEGIRDLLDQHVSNKMDHSYRLWLLMNLELWHRVFMRGDAKDDVEEMLRDCVERHVPAVA